MFDSPIAEVSGACFAGDRLVLIGDAKPQLAWAPWSPEGPGAWTVIDVAKLPGAPKRTGQFEAVEHLEGQVVVVLCEAPALLIAVDLSGPTLVGSWQLEMDLKPLRKAWEKDENSRGEGMFFGPERLFVVKEKDPTAVIEFGLPGQLSLGGFRAGTWIPPESETLAALEWWEIDGLADVSDACVVDGTIWLISDQDRCFGPAGGEFRRLPKQIDKPEGLARTPEGTWLVAVDNPDGKNALHIVAD